jgi:hypothetical protein
MKEEIKCFQKQTSTGQEHIEELKHFLNREINGDFLMDVSFLVFDDLKMETKKLISNGSKLNPKFSFMFISDMIQ